jgi:hypothetical protein
LLLSSRVFTSVFTLPKVNYNAFSLKDQEPIRLDAFAWPLAALLFGITFVLIFRAPVVRLLDRTKAVGTSGIQAYDAPQTAVAPRDAVEELLEGYQNPLLLEVEGQIDELLKARGIADLAQVKVLRKLCANAVILAEFERLAAVIYKSQIAALEYLNGHSPALREQMQPFYDDAASNYPRMYEHHDFKGWLDFMFSQVLIRQDKEELSITVRGREFLKWRLQEGRLGPYHG